MTKKITIATVLGLIVLAIVIRLLHKPRASLMTTSQLVILTTSLPPATLNQAYSAQFQAAGGGGQGTYTWIAHGLPAGMSMTSGGLLTGTPTTSGDFTLQVTVQSPASTDGQLTFTVASAPPPVSTNPIDPARRTDWSGAGVVGGIPTNRTQCGSTISAYSGSASNINAAISNCTSGHYVLLGSGTFNLSSGITFGSKSGVTLRGSGPTSTSLVFSAAYSCPNAGYADICIAGSYISDSSPANHATISSGYTSGSTSVNLTSVTGVSPTNGTLVAFDQTNDSSTTSGIFVCDNNNNINCAETSNIISGTYRANRAQNQLPIVSTYSGGTLTFSPPISMPNWNSSKAPQAYWPSTTLTGDGVENLSIVSSSSGSNPPCSGHKAIAITTATNSWVKNVRVINIDRAGVLLQLDSHISVLENYLYNTRLAVTCEYGAEVDRVSASRVENNIFERQVTPIMPNGGSSGNVYAYNYICHYYNSKTTSWYSEDISTHSAGVAMELIEGNAGVQNAADTVHGTHNFNTYFRNYLAGLDPLNSQWNNHSMSLEFCSYSRYFNAVGNVLGTAGYHNTYEATGSSNAPKSIYALGFGGQNGVTTNVPPDSITKTTLMRWGNYDTVHGSVQWNSSEVPSGISGYPNPVPPNHSLPASMYLSGAPQWWTMKVGTTPPFPAIGPDVTGGNGPGGFAYKIPAQLCYENTSSTNGIRNYNAANCYVNP